jgi:predicted Zn-dependent protease
MFKRLHKIFNSTALGKYIGLARIKLPLGLMSMAMVLDLTGCANPQAEGPSPFAQLVPAEVVEKAGHQEYEKVLKEAKAAHKLLPASNPQVKRVQGIAKKIIPFAKDEHPLAQSWQWEVNVIDSPQVNAFCLPGGKIVVYTGLINQLKLTNAELAQVISHEIAHVLREHARSRIGKSTATQLGVDVLSQGLGWGDTGQQLANYGAQLLNLKFSRYDELEADSLGLELAARAGFDPRAGLSLWRKMGKLQEEAPPLWLSTHPANDQRLAQIQSLLPSVLPLYEATKAKH